MDEETRFALLKELSHDPPFWFDRALMFCRFQPSQRNLLLQGTIKRPRAGSEQTSLLMTSGTSHIECAANCGLLEPILCSIAEHTGDYIDRLIETLMDAFGQKFPWMFLAYIGTRNRNTQMVQKCVNIIIGDLNKGKTLTNELGMLYVVWRFLVQAEFRDEWETLLKHIELEEAARHDWTFVHLASAYGDTECLGILLHQPCNQNQQVLAAATELEGFTPLHLAAWYGHAAAVKLLLEHEDRISVSSAAVHEYIPRDRIFGRSPLHYASHHCNDAVVEMLVQKWGSLGVGLQDRFGLTSLHLAGAPLLQHSLDRYLQRRNVLHSLFKAADQNMMRLRTKDFALQKAAMARLLVERRRYIDSTTSTLFIPSPTISDGFVWNIQGFTVFHYIAMYDTGGFVDWDTGPEVHDIEYAKEDFDCGGLTASDYSSARFGGDKILAVNEARGKILEGDPTADQVWRLRWVYNIDVYLLSGRYSSALEWFKNVHLFVSDIYTSTEKKRFKLDDEVWDQLEWALDKALQQDDSDKVNSAPRLHPSDAEEMVLMLVQKKVLYGPSPKQRCLQWAITKRMTRLAEELVKDTECELLSDVVPGGMHAESPLSRASKREVAKEMPGLLAAMELREDVKRRWFEDRQVYVDYANTLLVGAVLIAGLAFAGWLQPPRGYVEGIIDMQRRAVRVFVWSSSLAFFLGMGTVIAGAIGAMPFAIGAGQLVSARDKVHKSAVIASLLMVASIVCLAVSFSSAALAILPLSDHNVSITAFFAVNGLFLCYMLFSFLQQLQGLSSSILAPFCTNCFR